MVRDKLGTALPIQKNNRVMDKKTQYNKEATPQLGKETSEKNEVK